MRKDSMHGRIPIFMQVLSLSKLFEPQCRKGGQPQSSFVELRVQKSRFKLFMVAGIWVPQLQPPENEPQRLVW